MSESDLESGGGVDPKLEFVSVELELESSLTLGEGVEPKSEAVSISSDIGGVRL